MKTNSNPKGTTANPTPTPAGTTGRTDGAKPVAPSAPPSAPQVSDAEFERAALAVIEQGIQTDADGSDRQDAPPTGKSSRSASPKARQSKSEPRQPAASAQRAGRTHQAATSTETDLDQALSSLAEDIMSPPTAAAEAHSTAAEATDTTDDTDTDDEHEHEPAAAALDGQPNDAEADADPEGDSPAEDGEPTAEGEADSTADDLEDHGSADDDEEEELESLAARKRWPKSFLKRLKKQGAKIARLEAQLAEVSATPRDEPAKDAASAASAPATAVMLPDGSPAVSASEAKYAKEIAEVRANLRLLRDSPDGLTVGDQSFTAEQVEVLRERYEDRLSDLKAELRVATSQRKELARGMETEVVQRHPQLKDRTSGFYQAVERVLQEYPALRLIPMGRAMVADAIAYEVQRRQAARATAGKAGGAAGQGTNHGANGTAGTTGATGTTHTPTNGQAKPAPRATIPAHAPAVRATRPAAAPAQVNGRNAGLGNVTRRFMETGDADMGRELMAALIEAGD